MIPFKLNESITPAAALHVPIGAASPLWFMFTGAASAGVAYWWMTRWMAPMNLEALLPTPADAAPAEEAAVLTEAFITPLVEAVEPVLEAGVVDPDPAPIPAPEPAPNPLDTPPMEAAAEVAAPVIEATAKLVAPAPKAKPKTAPKA